jgi:uncharacterized protein
LNRARGIPALIANKSMELTAVSGELLSTTEVAPSPAPVAPSERIASIDLVRGFALLGILVMNIISFGMPDAVLFNPSIADGLSGLNFYEWLVSHLLFEHKMMTAFSMLFGAGLVLVTDRAVARGGAPARVFYRRAGVLLAFGLLHGYLFWEGDILYVYAVCGMLAYLVRKWPPWALLLVGAVVLVPPVFIGHATAGFFGSARAAAARVGAAQAGKAPSQEDKSLADAWNGIRREFDPTSEEVNQQIKARRDGTYWSIARERAPKVLSFQTFVLVAFVGWDALGRILLGMGLMKLGVFSAERSRWFYVLMVVLGYGLGLPLVAVGAYQLIQHKFDIVYWFGAGSMYNDFGSILVALGHIGALILLYKAGAFVWLSYRLAAIGRMALSNYLMHTIICTTLFYGYGFRLFGRLDRVQLLGIVFAIWALQLWLSPIWLRSFRFGPAEWLWRSLTYGGPQPMKVEKGISPITT